MIAMNLDDAREWSRVESSRVESSHSTFELRVQYFEHDDKMSFLLQVRIFTVLVFET